MTRTITLSPAVVTLVAPSVTPGTPIPDGNNAGVVMLLHFDGAEGDTATTDSGFNATAKTIVFADAARLTTIDKRFGSSCLLIPGSVGSWVATSSTDFAFGTGDLTFELWVKADDASRFHPFAWYLDDENFLGIELVTAVGPQATFRLTYRTGGIDRFTIEAAGQFVAGQWLHLAWTRESGTVRLFVGGALIGSASYADVLNLNAWTLNIGRSPHASIAGLRVGPMRIDEVRATTDARFVAAFHPSTNAYSLRSRKRMIGTFIVRATIRKRMIGTWGVVLTTVRKRLIGAWIIRGTARKRLIGTWGVMATARKRLIGTWDAGLHRSRKRLIGSWTIVGTARKRLVGSWDIPGNVARKRMIGSWDVVERSRKRMIGTWDVLETSRKRMVGSWRIENTSLDRWELYHALDAPPDLHAAPLATRPVVYVANKPTIGGTWTVAMAGVGEHRLVLERRNRFDERSEGVEDATVELDGAGLVIVVRPTAPTSIRVDPALAGTVRVRAVYYFAADSEVQRADRWAIYLRNDGTDPDPAIDTPTEVVLDTSGAASILDWTSPANLHGDDVRVILRTKRSGDGRESANVVVVSTIASTAGPVLGGVEVFAKVAGQSTGL